MSADTADRLGLPLMVGGNLDPLRTASTATGAAGAAGAACDPAIASTLFIIPR